MTAWPEMGWGEFKIIAGFAEKIGLFQEKEELFHFLTSEFADTFSTRGSVLFLKKQKSSDWDVTVTRRISRPLLSSLKSFAEVHSREQRDSLSKLGFPSGNGGELMVLLGQDGTGDCVLFLLKEKREDWSDKELSLVSLMANQASLSVENFLLWEELKGKAQHHLESGERTGLHGLIGDSIPMKELYQLIETVKDTRSTALIAGETGTGKELIARAIHFLGARREKNFVAHNCGATPDTLIESELFGHTRGSFTGATQDKQGLFEVADGGTFFLDEVADMSPMMQIRILRVLQEGEFRRVGETRSRKVDVRIIAATNKNLEEEIENGRFRRDLFYRLNVIGIKVPSLRERIEDIPILSEHFREKAGLKFRKEVSGFSNGAVEALMGYCWPGNVRELENEIERAVLLTPSGEVIAPEVFTETLRSRTSPVSGKVFAGKGSLREMRGKLERTLILETLSRHKGNKSQAARELGLTRQGLIKKLKGFGQLPLFE
ncbi:MAG: sigma-54 dependent transcriptional regulator [Candidatus Eisenbacteria bacterium]|nr:sigma-54 dependent transcriptional regulator [Candidatus Eisenbacteria bacterium]